MIVSMKKVYLILLDAYRESSLKELREIGVVHLEDCSGTSEALDAAKEDRDKASRAILGLTDAAAAMKGKKSGVPPVADLDDVAGAAKTDEVNALLAEKKKLEEGVIKIGKDLEFLAPWGDFNPADINSLKKDGIEVALVQIPKKAAGELRALKGFFEVGVNGSLSLFASVNSIEEIPAEAQTVALPEKGITACKQDIDTYTKRLEEIAVLLQKETAYLPALEKYSGVLQENLSFEEVKAGLGMDDQLAYLQGFVPVNRMGELRKAAADNSWGIMFRDPTDQEYVPTLVERKGPIKMAKPIFDLMGTLPGYREFDISLIFLTAFTIFVAMIVGDAGYGLIFLGLAGWGLMKAPESAKLPLKLVILLSSAIVVWGTITGTWFGSETIASWSPLNKLVIPQIASYAQEGIDSVMMVQLLCFIIGVTQLSLARIEMFIRTLPSLKAFEHLGWLSLLWGLFFLALNIVLGITSFKGIELTPYILPLAVAGFVLIVLFSNQQGRFFRDMLAGLNPINLLLNFLDGVSSFSNIISYIRLFAVGLSSVAVAASFNAMAASIGFAGPQAVGAVLMLIVGHGLNIILALMSIIVHGIRLNMLEYSGQLGLEWSGYAYDPFARRRAA